MSRLACIALTFVILLIAAGCGAGSVFGSDSAAVKTLATQEASKYGIGDLVIHETTIGEVVETYGSGKIEILYSDESAIELVYARGGLCIMCSPEIGSPGNRAIMDAGSRNLMLALRNGTVATEFPEVAALPITSIALRGPFYTGQTDNGVSIGSSFHAVQSNVTESESTLTSSFIAGRTRFDDLGHCYSAPGMLIYSEKTRGLLGDEDDIAHRVVDAVRDGGIDLGGPEVKMIVLYRE